MSEKRLVLKLIRHGTVGSLLLLVGLSEVVAGENDPKTVLIVSIGVLHPNALETEAAPTIRELMDKGMYTLDGKSVTPPLTLL